MDYLFARDIKGADEDRWKYGWEPLLPARASAARALRAIGPKAEPAIRDVVVPRLTMEVEDDIFHLVGDAWEALEQLGDLGDVAGPALAKLVRKRQPVGATRALWKMGPVSRNALAELLDDPSPAVRRAAVMGFVTKTMTLAGSASTTQFVPGLLRAMKEKDPKIRLAAALALTGVGPNPPPKLAETVAAVFRDPEVFELLEEFDFIPGHLRGYLKAFGEDGVRALLAVADSGSEEARENARHRLWNVSRSSAVLLAAVRKRVADPDPKVAIWAAHKAADMSFDPADTDPLFSKRLLFHPDVAIQSEAVNRIHGLWPVVAHRRNELKPLTQSPNLKLRELTAFLTKFDRTRQELVPTPLGPAGFGLLGWKRAQTDPDPRVRLRVAFEIARTRKDYTAFVPVLKRHLERGGAGDALTMFAQLPPDFPELIGPVSRAPACWPQTADALDALLKYGSLDAVSAAGVRAVLVDAGTPRTINEAFLVRVDVVPACKLLGAIGPRAADALPELRSIHEYWFIDCALAARDAIRKIEGK